MARVILAWELGSGFGHAVPLSQLARLLLERGHDVHLVWKDLSVCSDILTSLIEHPRLHIWQAPVWLRGDAGLAGPASYPELLLRAGYADAGRLFGCARGWQRLFDAIQPDLLVADHAPTAMLVARDAPVRVAMFGNGFVIPPACSPMPLFRDWEVADPARIAAAEAQALAVCNGVLVGLGKKSMTALQQLLLVDEHFLLGWPELDHQRRLRGDRPLPAWGWPPPPRVGVASKWPPGSSGRRLLGYLSREHPAIDLILGELRNGPWTALIHLVGANKAGARYHSDGKLVIADRLIDLSSVIDEADLLISHAGSGTLYAGLQAGVPALMLPIHAEQLLLARQVVANGAGVMMWPDEVGARFASALAAMLASPGFGAAARALAARQMPTAADVLPRIAARCDELSVQAR